MAVRKFASCTVLITNTLVTFTHVLQNMSYKTPFFLFELGPVPLSLPVVKEQFNNISFSCCSCKDNFIRAEAK